MFHKFSGPRIASEGLWKCRLAETEIDMPRDWMKCCLQTFWVPAREESVLWRQHIKWTIHGYWRAWKVAKWNNCYGQKAYEKTLSESNQHHQESNLIFSCCFLIKATGQTPAGNSQLIQLPYSSQENRNLLASSKDYSAKTSMLCRLLARQN